MMSTAIEQGTINSTLTRATIQKFGQASNMFLTTTEAIGDEEALDQIKLVQSQLQDLLDTFNTKAPPSTSMFSIYIYIYT